MTVRQILRSDLIVSRVPYKVKAEAVAAMLEPPVNEAVPATALPVIPMAGCSSTSSRRRAGHQRRWRLTPPG